ncbi:MAG TPA: Fe2+-dependent dioxygenase [Aliidongia sp.]|nr:Fe2+-dependent dioxygenase [Aliidongia sp.]
MLLQIPDVLGPVQLSECRRILAEAEWVDGRVTAGYQATRVKNNSQLPEDHPAARQAGAIVLAALERQPLFMSAALPLKVFPPMFNRYEGGQTFGVHVDTAIRQVAGTPHRVRTDLSATLFLSEPGDYEGGELVVADTFGTHSVKLPAGHMILYPGSSLHEVRPVTRGARLASFFWVQSLIRTDEQRSILFELDSSIQQLARTVPDHGAVIQLTNVYHNLLRHWSET